MINNYFTKTIKVFFFALAFLVSSFSLTAQQPATADLNNWKSPCFNCFNYALNNWSVFFAQIPHNYPEIPCPIGGCPAGGFTCASINAFITAAPPNGLGLVASPAPIPPAIVPVCPGNQGLVALSFIPGGCYNVGDSAHPDNRCIAGDFHWYRRNADGTWSQKHGGQPAQDTDDGGIPMTDAHPPGPGGAVATDLGGYTFCGYYCVPNPPNLAAIPGVNDTATARLWTNQVIGNVVSAIKQIWSGVVGAVTTISDLTTLSAHLPSMTSTVSDPHWAPLDGTYRGFNLTPGYGVIGFPPYMTVFNGVVAVYSSTSWGYDNINYYADDNGLEAYLLSQETPPPNIPTLSQWGLIIFGMILLAIGVVIIKKRQNLFLKK